MQRKSTLIKYAFEIARKGGEDFKGSSVNEKKVNYRTNKKSKKAIEKAYRLRLKNERPIHKRTVFQSGKVLKLDQFDRVMY